MQLTVCSTGGTIASTGDEAGATPTKQGAELVDAVPDLETHADITVETVAQVPSYEMDAATLERLGDRVRALAGNDGVDAILVTHGTDTMAETAYYLDVTVQPDVPVLLTGAQRRPDEVSPDGPSNLLTAVRAARAFHEHEAGGTFVAFDETIHAARTVTKGHTSRLDAFDSPSAGPVATVDREGVRLHRPPRAETRSLPAASLAADVFTITSGSAASGELLAAATERDPDGLVLAGTGLGNATAAIGDGVGEAIAQGVPVVVTSRCPVGRVTPVYGGDGGGQTLRNHGAIFAGDLPAQKARLRLMLALEAFDEPAAIRESFEADDALEESDDDRPPA